jgi:hypothetical protein
VDLLDEGALHRHSRSVGLAVEEAKKEDIQSNLMEVAHCIRHKQVYRRMRVAGAVTWMPPAATRSPGEL